MVYFGGKFPSNKRSDDVKNKTVKSLIGFSALLYLIFLAPSQVYAMHIMEGFLSKGWCLFWFALSAPFFIYGLIRMKRLFASHPEQKLLVALSGAFVFLLSALKIPSVTGSCSHPTGVGLGAVLFGPTIQTVLGTIVLLFQALLLAHGGLSTMGANVFSMAIVGPFVAFFVFKLCKKAKMNNYVSVFLAATLADLLTYVVTSLQLAVAFPDPITGFAGSLVEFLTVFAVTQIPIAIAEGILTVFVYDKIAEYEGKEKVHEIIR